MLSVGLIFTFLGWYPLVSLGAGQQSAGMPMIFCWWTPQVGKSLNQRTSMGFAVVFIFSPVILLFWKKKKTCKWLEEKKIVLSFICSSDPYAVAWSDLILGTPFHPLVCPSIFRQFYIFLIAKKMVPPRTLWKNLAFCHQTWLAGKYERWAKW